MAGYRRPEKTGNGKHRAWAMVSYPAETTKTPRPKGRAALPPAHEERGSGLSDVFLRRRPDSTARPDIRCPAIVIRTGENMRKRTRSTGKPGLPSADPKRFRPTKAKTKKTPCRFRIRILHHFAGRYETSPGTRHAFQARRKQITRSSRTQAGSAKRQRTIRDDKARCG